MDISQKVKNRIKLLTLAITLVSMLAGCVSIPKLTRDSNAANRSQQKAAVPTPKAWLAKDYIDKRDGDLTIRLNKDFSVGAPPTAFLVTIGSRTGVRAYFSGSCLELLEMKVVITDYRAIDTEKFYKTRRGEDLPGEIVNVMKAMQVVLKDQCEQLHVIRVAVPEILHMNKATRADRLEYKGTMLLASNWNLEDGFVRTQFDGVRKFEISASAPYSIVRAKYQGGCVANLNVDIKAEYRSQLQKSLKRSHNMHDYEFTMKFFIEKYRAECPDAESVKFKVVIYPEDYECEDKNECFFLAQKETGWQVVQTGLVPKRPIVSPVKNANDMSKYLQVGDFDKLEDYKSYFRVYYTNFITAYSQYCSEAIKYPVSRVITQLQPKYDVDGNIDHYEDDPNPLKIVIEKEYAGKFDVYLPLSQNWMLGKILSNMTQNPLGMAREFFDTSRQIEHTVKGHCTDETVQAIYKNMLKYSKTV